MGGRRGPPRAHAGPGGQRASPPNWPGPPSDLELSVALGPWKGVGVTVAACASTFGSLLWPEGLGGGFASHPLSAPLGADVTTPRVTERGRGRHGAPLGSHPPCPPCAWAPPCSRWPWAPGCEAGRASRQAWGPPGQVWKSCGDYEGIGAYTRSPWGQPRY